MRCAQDQIASQCRHGTIRGFGGPLGDGEFLTAAKIPATIIRAPDAYVLPVSVDKARVQVSTQAARGLARTGICRSFRAHPGSLSSG